MSVDDPHAALVARLEASLTTIQGVLLDLTASGKPVELDQTTQGRISRIDAITQQQMARAGRSHLLRELERIQAALARHAAGRYGQCCRCGLQIGQRRLGADPAAPFCLDCTEEIASERQQDDKRWR
jgi:DnaK suppressor protein